MKKKKELPPVNCHNEEEMIALGYRNPLTPRDKTVWTKTASEKKLLKQTKRKFKGYEFSSSWGFHKPSIPCTAKLIIELDKCPELLNKEGFSYSHLTVSYMCGQSRIPDYLNKFAGKVKRYKYNDKYYKPDELPFFYW